MVVNPDPSDNTTGSSVTTRSVYCLPVHVPMAVTLSSFTLEDLTHEASGSPGRHRAGET